MKIRGRLVALLVGGDRVVTLGPEGVAQDPAVALTLALPGLYRAFAVDGDTLAVAAELGAPAGAVHFRTYARDVHPLGTAVTLPAGNAHPGQVGLVRLERVMNLTA